MSIESEVSPGEQYANWKAPDTNPDRLMEGVKKERSEAETKLFASGWERIYEPTTNEQGHATIPDKAKTWNRNGNTLSATTTEGDKYARPYEEATEAELKRLNFEKNESMGVPYSTELPKNASVRERWQTLMDAANKRNRESEKPQ